jgi:hypothetical protein
VFAANQQIIRAEFFVLCFSLYVGVAVLGAPQDGLKGKLLFAVALFLYACWGVATEFFSTSGTLLHVEPAIL